MNHPNCRDFVADRLCRYLITDEPTKEMKQPIIDAFKKTDGHLSAIHKAAITVAFNYNKNYKKFQTPENWFIQMSKLSDFKWPPSPKLMDTYELGNKPLGIYRKPEWKLNDLGHNPYRAAQPNGFSDLAIDWISPELLIRRLVYAKDTYEYTRSENNNLEFYEKIVNKNFDNPDKILKIVSKRHVFSKNKSRVEIFEAFNLNSNVSIDDDISAHFEQNTLNLVRKISDCLKKSSSKADQKTAQELTEIASINLASIQLLEKIFLYGKSRFSSNAYRNSFCSYNTRNSICCNYCNSNIIRI